MAYYYSTSRTYAFGGLLPLGLFLGEVTVAGFPNSRGLLCIAPKPFRGVGLHSGPFGGAGKVELGPVDAAVVACDACQYRSGLSGTLEGEDRAPWVGLVGDDALRGRGAVLVFGEGVHVDGEVLRVQGVAGVLHAAAHDDAAALGDGGGELGVVGVRDTVGACGDSGASAGYSSSGLHGPVAEDLVGDGLAHLEGDVEAQPAERSFEDLLVLLVAGDVARPDLLAALADGGEAEGDAADALIVVAEGGADGLVGCPRVRGLPGVVVGEVLGGDGAEAAEVAGLHANLADRRDFVAPHQVEGLVVDGHRVDHGGADDGVAGALSGAVLVEAVVESDGDDQVDGDRAVILVKPQAGVQFVKAEVSTVYHRYVVADLGYGLDVVVAQATDGGSDGGSVYGLLDEPVR